MLRRNTSIHIDRIAELLYALCIIKGVWLAFDKPEYSYVLYMAGRLVPYMAVLLGLFVVWRESKTTLHEAVLVILPLTYWVMCMLHTYRGWSIGDGVMELAQICVFLVFSRERKVRIFTWFYRIVLFLNAISLLVWILYQLGVDIGFTTVPYYFGSENGRRVYVKWSVFALYHESIYTSILFSRLCGIFNEPGALGTLCALLFIVTYPYAKRWEKLLLLATGAATYSLAFFLLVFAFAFVHLIRRDSRYILLAIALVAFFLMIPEIDWGSPVLNELAARMKIEDGMLAGDNREKASFIYRYGEMKKTSRIWWGYGKGRALDISTSSFRTIIVWFGYLGFGLIMLQWGTAALYYGKTIDDYIFVGLFFLSLYQRPMAIFSLYGYGLLFGGMCWSQSKITDGEKPGKIKDRWRVLKQRNVR